MAGALVTARLALLLVAAAVDVVARRLRPLPETSPCEPPLIAVIVPAFNEERVIEGTVRSALASDWPNLRVVVVDDGSGDRTWEVASRLAAEDPRVIAVAQRPNQGKAAALNAGVAAGGAEVVVSVDADTVLAPDAVRLLAAPVLRGLGDAVASNLKVGNRDRALTVFQSLEYVVALHLGRRAQAALGCITTIPGAAGAFRVEAVRAVGGWSGDTRTEDTDLTLALLRAGRRVLFQPRAVAFTEAPQRLRGLMHQRARWMYGYLQCLWKHRRAFLRLDVLGLFGMPNLLFVHLLVFPLLLGSLPYLLRVATWTTWEGLTGVLIGVWGVDLAIACAAYAVDREDPRELLLAPVQRVAWPLLLTAVFFRVWANILRRSAVAWNKLARDGAVADAVTGGKGPGVLR